MISQASEFKLLDRGFKENLVLIPGWATDYRVFSDLRLDYNYILPIRLCAFDFQESLKNFLGKKSIDKISLFGWSLGGILASGFASHNPGIINKLIILGVRNNYDRKELEGITKKLHKNKKAYLYRFYLECFSDMDKEGLSWFKKNLLKKYLEELRQEDLLIGLEYLLKVKIEPLLLSFLRDILIIHGTEDKISPFSEALQLKSEIPHSELICMHGLGHLLFLNSAFNQNFING